MSVRRANESLDLRSIMSGRQKSVLIAQPSGLEAICFLLNNKEPSELCSELQILVRDWQTSGPNLAKLLRQNAALAARVRHGRTLLVPTESGKGHLLWLPTRSDLNPSSWKVQALAHFMDLVVNPQWHKLGGPCHRCKKYYIKKTSRQKSYCSRKCGAMTTGLAATQKRRAEERTNKLNRVQAAAHEWTKTQTRDPWKDWVSGETKVTVKWITRAVNKGALKVPVKDVLLSRNKFRVEGK
jgi:hypothetical protein